MRPSSLTGHQRWGLTNVQPAPHLWEMGFVPVCNQPTIPPNMPKKRSLSSVRPAPHPSWEMRIVQWLTSPSSLLRIRFSQCAMGPHRWLCLRDEAYPLTQCAVSPSSLTLPERWGSPSVQPAPHPSQWWGLASVQIRFAAATYQWCGKTCLSVIPVFLILDMQ